MFFRKVTLTNGLYLHFFNKNRCCFGDYFDVTVEIRCKILLCAEFFASDGAFATARNLLGEHAVYCRDMHQTGVPSMSVDAVMQSLVDNFLENSATYFLSPSFPHKLIASELRKISKKNNSHSIIAMYSNE